MSKMHEMTVAELVERHNELAPDRPLKGWKGAKAKLIERVEALSPARASVRAMCEALIRSGLGNREVAERVRGAVPGARTSPGSVAWYRHHLKKGDRP